MPEKEFPKLRPHPFRAAQDPLKATGPGVPARGDIPPWAELCVTSNYTFLTGASHPEEYVVSAAALGYRAIAITDTNTIAGVVRAQVAAKEAGIRFVLGTRVRLRDCPRASIFVYPCDMAGYRTVCRLLTTGKRRAPKGECHLDVADLAMLARSVVAICLPDHEHAETGGAGSGGAGGGVRASRVDNAADELEQTIARLGELFDGDRLSLGLSFSYGFADRERAAAAQRVSVRTGVPLVATNDVHQHAADRRMLQDVLTCIRHGCTIAQAGLRLHANAERHLKHPVEMHRLFAEFPGAIRRAQEIVECTAGFGLEQLRYEYPDEVVPPGLTAMQHLTELTWKGAAERFPGGAPEKVRTQIEHELALIEELAYAPYFLTVHDLVRFARDREDPILCQGRGAAANSAVCYCLGVTSVDPTRIDMLFERFVSRERHEPPDIDIDFEHERREEVIQYIYRKYGRDRAALTAEVISYRRRSAVRDVGKALGLSLDLVDTLAKDIEWFDRGMLQPAQLREFGLNPDDQTIRWLVRLTSELLGFPRHLSQHVGGFVITRSPLCELVPVENAAMPDRTVIEWDKDDIDAMGMLKVDVLGLGMLSAINRCLNMVNARLQRRSTSPAADASAPVLALHTIPPEDASTYAMIQRADTVGVFQIESRAQMSMLPRLKPACFYDLVIEVAIVRPGPIQGDMVHPYLRRRNGEEPVDYVHPSIEEVLKKTLGVPLFQEQCMALAVKAAGFTPGQADQLRRAMAAWKRKGDQIYRFGQQIIEGMTSRGIPLEFASRCFEQIKGFSEYGFPESHAASFALLVYASAWLKHHYPAEFCAALINSQPMGFYAPAQLVRDAKEHGVVVRPIDVNHSAWDCTIEEDGAVRLGMRLVAGLARPEADAVRGAVESRGEPFTTMLSLWRGAGVKAATMRRLASADAFGSMGLSRQTALWHARLLRDERLPLFEEVDQTGAADAAELPEISAQRHVVLDYNVTGLSLKAHPVSFARPRLEELKVIRCVDLQDAARTPEGVMLAVAGIVLVRQRPGTAEGVTFMTIEDETGIANLVLWRRVYQKYRRVAGSKLLIARGRVQRQGLVVHVIVSSLHGLNDAVAGMRSGSRDFR